MTPWVPTQRKALRCPSPWSPVLPATPGPAVLATQQLCPVQDSPLCPSPSPTIRPGVPRKVWSRGGCPVLSAPHLWGLPCPCFPWAWETWPPLLLTLKLKAWSHLLREAHPDLPMQPTPSLVLLKHPEFPVCVTVGVFHSCASVGFTPGLLSGRGSVGSLTQKAVGEWVSWTQAGHMGTATHGPATSQLLRKTLVPPHPLPRAW